MSNIADIRKDYRQQILRENEVNKNAVMQFGRWWEEALNSAVDEVNAFTLATASLDGKPSARIVLLKGYDENGFVFFTNYVSNKGYELAKNPHACMVFFWKELERQIRIVGEVGKVSNDESDAYFNSRPVGSRIGAWSSPQSVVIDNREFIEENVQKYEQKFIDGNIPRPPHWGGYRLKPALIEFWQGRTNRLHDRLQYTLQKEGDWKIERLAP